MKERKKEKKTFFLNKRIFIIIYNIIINPSKHYLTYDGIYFIIQKKIKHTHTHTRKETI